MKPVHVALLGDSIFDSRPYLRDQPDMALRLAGQAECRTSLLAVSGSRLGDIDRQLARVPSGTSHLLVSAGGNDLLDLGRRLQLRSGNLIGQLGQASGILKEFQQRYATVCKHVAATGLPTALCLIYGPPVADPLLRQLGSAALHMANSAIGTEAKKFKLDVIDLRKICREPADFFDPIHPSALGAEKIAAALTRWVRTVPR